MVVIADYGVGNLNSIKNMLKKAGADSVISSDSKVLSSATKILLPGMGHFDNCMKQFNNSGLREIIEEKVIEQKTPVLGICVGLQMMMNSSEEGKEKGLGWISGKTIRLNALNYGIKIPHMGWQEVTPTRKTLLIDNIENPRFYFAHSFYVSPDEQKDILLTVKYGYDFPVGIEKDNIVGVQFHPEKSHNFGMQLLTNFIKNY